MRATAATAPASVPEFRASRNTAIAAGVVLFHVAALWALQSGLIRRAAEVIVPVEILAQIVEPPAPKIEPPAPKPEPPAPAPPPKPAPVRKVQPPAPPKPVAVPSPAPAPETAPVGVTTPQPPAPPIAAPVAEAPPAPPASPAPPAPPKVELPSSAADYLRNPPPVYPAMSKRLQEQGKVLVSVLIGADGNPKQVRLKQSSGFDRLDRAALEYAMKCRYVPGKVGGVAQDMWYDAPINFVLE